MIKVVTVSESQFVNLKMGELKLFVKKYYNDNFKGKTVINIHTGVSIVMGSDGLRHTVYGRRSGYIKLKAVVAIPRLLANATYCNFKKANPAELKNKIIGFLNFKADAIIEGRKQNIRLTVRLTATGKFYYDLSLKAKK